MMRGWVYDDKLHINVRKIQTGYIWLSPITGLNPFLLQGSTPIMYSIIVVKEISMPTLK